MKRIIEIPSPMIVYRIEHAVSRLGPYEHAGQIGEVLNKGIRATKKSTADIDELPEVRQILRANPEAKFAFSAKDRLNDFVKDSRVLNRYGFVVSEYRVIPLYVSQDQQVLYNPKLGHLVREYPVKQGRQK